MKNEILRQVKSIVKKGLLNEKNNKNLLIEKITAIVIHYQSKYLGIKDRRQLSKYLPITFDNINYYLRFERAYRYNENKLIQEKIEKGYIKQQWKGSIVSYHYSLSAEDLDIIRHNAEFAATSDAIFKIALKEEARYLKFGSVEKILLDAMQDLREQGFNSIKELILPERDRLSSLGWVFNEYSNGRLVEYILRIYQIFLEEYKKLIETNFYPMKDKFELYSYMPVKCFITVRKGIESCWANIYICSNKESCQNETIIVNHEDVVCDNKDWNIVKISEREHHLIKNIASDISMFFGGLQHNYSPIAISKELIPIRNMVYEQIESELDNVETYLYNAYGLNK